MIICLASPVCDRRNPVSHVQFQSSHDPFFFPSLHCFDFGTAYYEEMQQSSNLTFLATEPSKSDPANQDLARACAACAADHHPARFGRQECTLASVATRNTWAASPAGPPPNAGLAPFRPYIRQAL
ncbi:hypothetical protein C8R44DRAFT_981803 [Mycena epipterygia]|nr:hypothetical protein C8R44DRAFT_981803 [Mycena epipterygia]